MPKPKTLYTVDQLLKLQELTNDIPKLVTSLGKDGKQIQAFYDDAVEALNTVESLEEKAAILQSLLLVALKVRDCSRKFSFDPFKPLRILCDDIARNCNFKRYKALRKL